MVFYYDRLRRLIHLSFFLTTQPFITPIPYYHLTILYINFPCSKQCVCVFSLTGSTPKKSGINVLQPNEAKWNTTKVGQALVVVAQPETRVDSRFVLISGSIRGKCKVETTEKNGADRGGGLVGFLGFLEALSSKYHLDTIFFKSLLPLHTHTENNRSPQNRFITISIITENSWIFHLGRAGAQHLARSSVWHSSQYTNTEKRNQVDTPLTAVASEYCRYLGLTLLPINKRET